jgi:Ca-activated chloride channel family protein
MSVSFLWPWALAAFPLPFLLRALLPRARQNNDSALHVPHLAEYQNLKANGMVNKTTRWPLLLYTLAWLCLLLAASRPQWTGDAIELPVSGRDLMLAIDFSKSMDQPIRHNLRSVSRITATKAVASAFIEKRVGDRIGLIIFADQAYVQAPLTFDRTTVNILLQEAFTGLAGQATAIGDAIGLAVKRLSMHETQAQTDNKQTNNSSETSANTDKTKQPTKQPIGNEQVLILLTDGVSNRGELTPLKAAEIAAKKGLKIYTIGIADRGSREVDEVTLRQVAQITGGQYFRAYNTSDLVKIYQLLDELEAVEKDVKSYRPTKSLFYIPLTASLLFAAMLTVFLYLPHFFNSGFQQRSQHD